MTLLRVTNLGRRFGSVVALDGVSFEMAPGSRTAVVGPSGSGKTTLLRIIAGFESPDAGNVELDGVTIVSAERGVPAHRRAIGLMMQEGALFPHLSGLDNIRFGIRRERGSQERAYALMDVVKLDRDMAGRQPHQLSGGQQQRVALARALARKPRLMLLDEPFSALDTALRGQTREATAEVLASAGIATLLVTHDQDEAMSFADQLIVLRDGKLVQMGRPRDVYAAPVDLTTAQFLGPSIILDGTVGGGVAHCALGTLPLRDDQRLPEGSAKLLLRPEQVSLIAATGDASASNWVVSAIGQSGSFVRVTLVSSGDADTEISLVAIARDVPPKGSRVNIVVLGSSHRLR
jgi:iron(III) transport system ATP-binding protein